MKTFMPLSNEVNTVERIVVSALYITLNILLTYGCIWAKNENGSLKCNELGKYKWSLVNAENISISTNMN